MERSVNEVRDSRRPACNPLLGKSRFLVNKLVHIYT